MDRRRSLAFAALTAALAAALALPTAASAKTRWVDDDGKAGPTGCSGVATAKKGIQAAITASGAGDVIKVCPGTYVGRLTIQGARDGLVIRSMTPKAAIVQPRADVAGSIVTIDRTSRVTLRGLSIQANADDDCGGGRAGVQVDSATGVVLRGLDLRATGTATLSGCMLSVGIFSVGSKISVIGGSIVDFSSNAVNAYDGGSALIDGLAISYAHASEPKSQSGVGISIQSGTLATIRNVTVSGIATAGDTTPALSIGIRIDAPNAIIENIAFDHLAEAVRLASRKGADVSGVTVNAVSTGITATVPGATGATIHDNDLTGATNIGCRDDTTGGTGTLGTKNTWTNNTTSTPSSPVGLCGDPS